MQEPILRADDLILNPETHEVYKDGLLLDLSPLDFALLELFMRHPRRVFTRETLLNRVWGYEYTGGANVVDVHVAHLREKIEDDRQHLIHTVYGVGYSFRPGDA